MVQAPKAPAKRRVSVGAVQKDKKPIGGRASPVGNISPRTPTSERSNLESPRRQERQERQERHDNRYTCLIFCFCLLLKQCWSRHLSSRHQYTQERCQTSQFFLSSDSSQKLFFRTSFSSYRVSARLSQSFVQQPQSATHAKCSGRGCDEKERFD